MMEDFVFALRLYSLSFIVLGLPWMIYKLFKSKQWERTFSRLNLKWSSMESVTGSKKGRREGFWVQIDTDKEEGGIIVIDGRGQIPEELSLSRSEHPYTWQPGPYISTGDTILDQRVRISGSELLALVVLGHEVRRLVLREVVHKGAVLKKSQISLRVKRLAEVEEALLGLLELARGLAVSRQDLATPGYYAAQLAHCIEHDPSTEVRVRSLRMLLDRFAQDEVATATCHRLLDSSPTRLRLEAAMFLQAEGIDAVVDIATNSEAEENLRVRAIEHLTRASWAQRVIPVMERLLEDTCVGVQRAVITALAQFRDAATAPGLQALLRESDPDTAVVIVRALGRIGNPCAEQSLIETLTAEETELVQATVEALGRVGGAAAVEPLLAVTRSSLPRTVRQEARDAISSIQSRLAGAEKGQVSVVNNHEPEGGLSPTEADTGGLSHTGEIIEEQ